jgi:uncharacterized protein (TIGR03382 family)
MRWTLLLPLALTGTLFSGLARADCAGPGDCFCARTSSTAAQVVGSVQLVVPEGDAQRVTLQVESVHGQSSLQPGDTFQVTLWYELPLGTRVLTEQGAAGAGVYGAVELGANGKMTCSGFTTTDLTVDQVIAARRSEECYTALFETGARFDSAPCNDVVTSPFGCSATGAAGGVWWALGLMGLGVLRRRRG